MIPTHENELFNQMMATVTSLPNHYCLNAYPQLSPVFMELSAGMQSMLTNALARQRQEIFYGMTPWAKLYKMQTGHDIRLPEGVIKNLCPDRWTASSNVPIVEIAMYAVEHRGIEQKLFHFENGDGVKSTVILDNCNAIVSWPKNDMFLSFDKINEGRAKVECPLFHEPYTVDVEMTFLEEHVIFPLYHSLVGDEHIHVLEPKHLLIHHYYGTVEEPIPVPDSHPFKQLSVLFSGDMYSALGRRWAEVEFKGRIIRFSGDCDWSLDAPYPNKFVKISSVSIPDEGKDNRSTIQHWHKNPLFVRDLLANMDSLLDKMITEHELSMKDDPTTV